jgi:hypothetical protein
MVVTCPCGSSLAMEKGGTLEHHTDGSHTFHPAPVPPRGEQP